MVIEFLPPLPMGEVVAATTTAFTAQVIEVPRPDIVSSLPDPPAFGAFVRVGGGTFQTQPPRNSNVRSIASSPTVSPDDFDPFENAFAPEETAVAPLAPTTYIRGVDEDDVAPGNGALYAVVFHAETGSLEANRPLTAFGLSEDELRREQPQIYELLTTRFSAALIGRDGPDGANGPALTGVPPRPPRPHARVYACNDAEIQRLTHTRLDFLRPLLAGAVTGAACPADDLVAAVLRRAWRAHNGDEDFILRAGRELAHLLPNDFDRLRAIVQRLLTF